MDQILLKECHYGTPHWILWRGGGWRTSDEPFRTIETWRTIKSFHLLSWSYRPGWIASWLYIPNPSLTLHTCTTWNSTRWCDFLLSRWGREGRDIDREIVRVREKKVGDIDSFMYRILSGGKVCMSLVAHYFSITSSEKNLSYCPWIWVVGTKLWEW